MVEDLTQRTDWRTRWMQLAEHVASWSKDPSTKVAAVIVTPENTVCSTGYNGFPRGIADVPARLADRKYKNALTVHAEENAIFNHARVGGRALLGCSMYVNGLPPCQICAHAIIQVGLTAVYVSNNVPPARWRESCAAGAADLKEAGVLVYHVPLGVGAPSASLTTIKRILKETLLGIDIERVTLESRLVEDLGADSLDMVELLMAAEEHTGEYLPDTGLEKCVTVGDAVRLIEQITGRKFE